MTPIEQAKACAAHWRKVAQTFPHQWFAGKARETADLLERLAAELERP